MPGDSVSGNIRTTKVQTGKTSRACVSPLWLSCRSNRSPARIGDETAADNRQGEPVPSPLSLVDHETRCRPAHETRALPDPEQTDQNGDAADEKQCGFHLVQPKDASMSTRDVHSPSLALDRRSLLGSLGLPAVLLGGVARAAWQSMPDF